MSVSLRSFTFSRLVRASAALWLCWAGAAWAGDGGESQTTLQTLLDLICPQVGMAPCPQLPTAPQIAAEISGLINSPPDDVRNVIFGSCGNLALFTSIPCPQVAVNAVNAPVRSPPEGPLAISYLTPLAFKPGAAVTQNGDPAAKRFLYATVLDGPDGQPQLLNIFLDDTSDTRRQFSKGPVIAFSLPLVILKNGTESPVAATLQLTATCNGAANCLTGTVTGIPGTATKPPSPAQLGIQFNSSFGASPNSTTSHRQYELLLPIIATPDNDSAYFSNPLSLSCPNGNAANPFSGYCNAFSNPVLGFAAAVLGSGASIGVAPYAAPLCTTATCPAQPVPPPPIPPPPPTTFFGFCASFARVPAVATFLQIGTDGMTTITTPVSPQDSSQNIQCPPLN